MQKCYPPGSFLLINTRLFDRIKREWCFGFTSAWEVEYGTDNEKNRS